MWNKKHFSSFLKGFQLPKIVSGLECAFNAYSNGFVASFSIFIQFSMYISNTFILAY